MPVAEMPTVRSASNYPTIKGAGVVLLFTAIPVILAGFLSERMQTKWPLLLGGLALLPAYVYMRRRRLDYRVIFRLRLVSGRVVGVSVMIGFAVTVLAIEVDRLVNLLLPFPEHMETMLQRTLNVNGVGEWVAMLLSAVVFVGIFEEMLFRGFVQNAFEQRHQPAFAIFITAILFGAVHLNPWWFLQFIFIAFILDRKSVV